MPPLDNFALLFYSILQTSTYIRKDSGLEYLLFAIFELNILTKYCIFAQKFPNLSRVSKLRTRMG